MLDNDWKPLLSVPTYPTERYAGLADRIGRLLSTRNDILLVQAEAVVALEAVAASLSRPGLKALNIVTSPYGVWFGQWMRRGGAHATDVVSMAGLPIDVDAVAKALDANPGTEILALVHAESASGILNPLPEILALAQLRGIVTVVDAVASIGGHPLDVDGLGIDIAVIGPQKALSGPAGVSALSVSPRGWDLILRDGAPTASILSLTDLKVWIDGGCGALPGTPAPLEFFALEAALDRVESEGLDTIVARHRRAADATRAGLLALGASAWAASEKASNLVTAVPLPDGCETRQVIASAASLGIELTGGVGVGAHRLIRLNHTGSRASFSSVLPTVAAYGLAVRRAGLKADIAAASDVVAAVYGS